MRTTIYTIHASISKKTLVKQVQLHYKAGSRVETANKVHKKGMEIIWVKQQ